MFGTGLLALVLITYVCVGLAFVVGHTVWFGLTRLVDAIGKIGPLIILFAITIGLVGVVLNPGRIAE